MKGEGLKAKGENAEAQREGLMARLLTRLLPLKVIVNCDREPYLYRWYLVRTKWVAIFVHRFVRSDEDRALHDHPWPFLVIPIWRGYVEHSDQPHVCGDCDGCGTVELSQFIPTATETVLCGWCGGSGEYRRPIQRRVFPFIGARYRSETYRHRVELIDGKPAWSIFIRFRECRDWGFWMPGGFVQWNQFWKEKCE
jgi:hypothetical protein